MTQARTSTDDAASDDDYNEVTLFDDLQQVVFKPPPITQYRSNDWTVLDRHPGADGLPLTDRGPDGFTKRLLKRNNGYSLAHDQTSVEIRSVDGKLHFVRDSLCHNSAQVFSLSLALSAKAWPPSPLFVVLGGAGFAFPMALKSSLPSAEIWVWELDAEVVQLARSWFGVAEAEGDSFHVVQDNALNFSNTVFSQPIAALVVDIDPLMIGDGCPEFLSETFWRAAWALMMPGCTIAANTIGATPGEIDSFANNVLRWAPVGFDLCAGVVEPSDESEWTLSRPRPSIMILGSAEALAPFESPSSLHDQLIARGVQWATKLSHDVLDQLVNRNGHAAVWRKIATE